MKSYVFSNSREGSEEFESEKITIKHRIYQIIFQ